MRRIIIGVALALGLITVSPAYASTGGQQVGSMTYGEYDNTWVDETWGQIDNHCNCQGTFDRSGGAQWVLFKAYNPSFAWNICFVGIHMVQGADNVWRAGPSKNGKYRVNCDGTIYWDNINTVIPAKR